MEVRCREEMPSGKNDRGQGVNSLLAAALRVETALTGLRGCPIGP
jgi:hypothetical protein